MLTSAIEGLSPIKLWKRFFEISQIPRPSKNEERVRLYLRNFSGQNNFDMKEDEVGNVVILVPAKLRFENTRTVVLQSHIDMVCEKNKDTKHDFTKDPIKFLREGEWIKADGTTLGADNGIGAAAALAVSQDDDFIHGPLELLFTVDEETGLTGANNLQKDFITGKMLLNLDTEEDGAFYVGCAGGMDSVGTFKIEYEEPKKGYVAFTLNVSGLKGGHSGINISDGRANAIKIIGLLISMLEKYDYQLAYLNGGSKRNAIPREAEAVIFLSPDNDADVRELINTFSLETVLEFRLRDDSIKINFERDDAAVKTYPKAYTKQFSTNIINTILAMPHGVIAMSADIPELVATSTNLATIEVESDKLKIGTSQRSSIESAKKNVAKSVKAVFDLAGAEITVGDGYPGWQPDMNSELLMISKKVFRNLFSKNPELKAVHAGLECGILGDKYPGLQMVSFGPTIEGAHSPDEKVKIADVDKFYRLLKNILTEIANSK